MAGRGWAGWSLHTVLPFYRTLRRWPCASCMFWALPESWKCLLPESYGAFKFPNDPKFQFRISQRASLQDEMFQLGESCYTSGEILMAWVQFPSNSQFPSAYIKTDAEVAHVFRVCLQWHNTECFLCRGLL